MLWIQKVHSKAWVWSLGYITPEICRVQCQLQSLCPNQCWGTLTGISQERCPKLLNRLWSLVKCPQEYPIPGPCCSRDGPSHSQIPCRNSPSFSVLQQSKSWRVTEQPLRRGAASAQRCCHKAWVGPRAPKTCNSKTPLHAAAAPETLRVAEPGGRAKGSPLAMGLAPMLCNGLNKCVSAML